MMYDAERRVHEETDFPTLAACGNACASAMRLRVALSWRRSAEDWKQFVETHAARYKFRLNQEAVAFLAKAAPLHTPEWDAWSARTAHLNLAGRWLVTASILGRGKYYGEMRRIRQATTNSIRASS